MNSLQFFSFLFLTLSCVRVEATVQSVILLQDGLGNRIFLFPDVHLDLPDGKKSTQQQADVLKYAKKLKAHMIVEDPCNYSGENKILKKIIKEYSDRWQELCFGRAFMAKPEHIIENTHFYADFFLSNMIRKCDYKGISYFNAECRHAKRMADGSSISGKMVYEEFVVVEKKIRSELEKIKLNPRYQAVYKWGIERLDSIIQDLMPLMNFLKSCSKNYSEFMQDNVITVPGGLPYDYLYDKELIDLNIIAHLCNNMHNKIIFICAGAAHIFNILPVLEKLGFKDTFVLGSSYLSSDKDVGFVESIRNAPDIDPCFTLFYEHAQICSLCNQHCADSLLFIQHKRECEARASNRQFLLWSMALIATGIAVVKGIEYIGSHRVAYY